MDQKYQEEMRKNIVKSILWVLVLHLLKEKPLCGNEIVTKLEKRTGVYVSPAMLYNLLKSFKSKNLVFNSEVNSRKKDYALTNNGNAFRRTQIRHFFNLNELIEGWLKAE